jgi:hypothetical protein
MIIVKTKDLEAGVMPEEPQSIFAVSKELT